MGRSGFAGLTERARGMQRHKWSKWSEAGIIKLFESTTPRAGERPVSCKLVQQKECSVCGKIKARKIDYVS